MFTELMWKFKSKFRQPPGLASGGVEGRAGGNGRVGNKGLTQ